MTEYSKRRITDERAVREAVEETLRALEALRMDPALRRAAALQDSPLIRRWQTALRQRMDEPFTLAVVGDFKRGKSTLINALLGRVCVPMNVLPETVSVNRLTYAQQPYAQAVLANGARIRLEEGELSRERMEALQQNLPAPILHTDVGVPAEALQGLSIVDTPGLNDATGQRDAQVIGAVLAADAVLYVTTALVPLSESERAFLAACVQPQGFARLFVLVNACDTLDAADSQRVVARVSGLLSEVLPQARVLGISALDELCRRIGRPVPHPDVSDGLHEAFATFEGELQSDILLRRGVIKAERMAQSARQALSEVRAYLQREAQVLGMDGEALAQSISAQQARLAALQSDIDRTRRDMDALADRYAAEAMGWMRELLGRLRAELQAAETSVPSAELQKHVPYYLPEAVREGMLACLREHTPAIGREIRAALGAEAGAQGPALAEGGQDTLFELADISYSAVDGASFVTSTGLNYLTDGVFTPFHLIASMVGGFIRTAGRKADERRGQLLAPVLERMGELETQVESSLQAAYRSYTRKICEDTVQTLTAQLSDTLQQLTGAQGRRQALAERSEALQADLQAAFALLDTADAALDALV